MDAFYKYIAEAYANGVPKKEIVEQCKERFGFGSHSSVSRAAQKLNLSHPNRNNIQNAKIEVDSTLTKGVLPMKPTPEQLQAFRQHCDEHGLPFDLWRAYWHKTNEYSSFFVNQEAIDEQNQFAEQLLADIARKGPKRNKRKNIPQTDHLLVLPMADIHFGKWLIKEETSFEYNLDIVAQRVREGTAELLQKAKSFGVTDYVVCLGNDMLHTDDGKTTTSGTPQDNDGSWQQNYRVALQVMRSIVGELANKGNVHLVYVPANHDRRSGFALSHAVAGYFHNDAHVSTGVEQKGITEIHRKYYVFGHNLIMFTHGDGAKEKDLHWLMATEAAEMWSRTKFRYVYLGHYHTKSRKTKGHNPAQLEADKIGYTEINTGQYTNPEHDVYIEIVRSPTPADGWHHRNGYISQGKQAVECFLHHPTGGQVARFTHFF